MSSKTQTRNSPKKTKKIRRTKPAKRDPSQGNNHVSTNFAKALLDISTTTSPALATNPNNGDKATIASKKKRVGTTALKKSLTTSESISEFAPQNQSRDDVQTKYPAIIRRKTVKNTDVAQEMSQLDLTSPMDAKAKSESLHHTEVSRTGMEKKPQRANTKVSGLGKKKTSKRPKDIKLKVKTRGPMYGSG
ncbi:hypothetical protein JCM33374_g5479 [Metschnikowia sp. JCM 33374]|nr:hypothetical protein JCM33374_g5479 [Metschnikowia sp. JCM 33374]